MHPRRALLYMPGDDRRKIDLGQARQPFDKIAFIFRKWENKPCA